MKAASLNELKKELATLNSVELIGLCLQLAKYKKENKELLSYLLFDANDEATYCIAIKTTIDEAFEALNTDTLYYAKKGLQKMVRGINKHIKYSGNKQTEAEVLIHFCKTFNNCGIDFRKHSVLYNLYQRQLVKIEKALKTLHEDIRHDYDNDLAQIA